MNRMLPTTYRTAIFVLALSATATVNAQETETQIGVTYENYNQAETSRNFNNWVKMGSDNKMVHRKELSPIGTDAPTIRMNLDTLYSVGVFNNDGDMSVTIPKSGLYQSVMILDTDGYLMEGNSHISSYTWKPNNDGTITVHFNAEGKQNNITSGGKEFN